MASEVPWILAINRQREHGFEGSRYGGCHHCGFEPKHPIHATHSRLDYDPATQQRVQP